MHLRWYGDIHRGPEMAPKKKNERMQVEGTRRRGRPLKTWMEGVKKDMMDNRLTERITFL